MQTILSDDADIVLSRIDLSSIIGKKILITGASGLVGINMVSCIKKIKGVELWCWFRENIDDCFVDVFNGCNLIQGDITDHNMFDSIPHFDFIIHAAGYAQPSKFLEDKIKTIQINTTSTILLMEKLNVNGTFLFVSSSEIYNGLDRRNIQEDQIGTTNTDHPRSCYIEGKRAGEAICHAYLQKGHNIKIARLSSAYGAGTKKNDKRVLNSLIERGLTKEKIELMDDGSAIRTFCYITDITEMLLNIMIHSNKSTYNIGGICELSIRELANRIGLVLGKKIIVPSTSSSIDGNPKIVNVSVQRYLDEFGKKSTDFVDFDEGLKRTIDWQTEFVRKNIMKIIQ